MKRLDELREEIYTDQNYLCYVCKQPLARGRAQLAHIIGQSKMNLRRYGKEMIHSRHNLRAVCCLKCNKMVDIGNSRAKTDLQAAYIKGKLKGEKE